MTVSFGVLGPLTAGPVPLRGNRQRAVLARLLVANGHVVPVGTLVDDLWPDDPPDRAIAAIRTFVADLRRALEPGRPPRRPSELLVTAPPGYALHARDLDARHFTDAVLHPSPTLARLDDALALWRGPAYAEFAEEGWARAEIDRLNELRALAVERRAQALLDLGRAAEAAPSLQAHVADHPLREEAWHLLATTLYRAGRQGDALAALRRARALLVSELGIDPGPRLRALESDILSQAPHLHKPQDQIPATVRPNSPPASASNSRPGRPPSAAPEPLADRDPAGRESAGRDFPGREPARRDRAGRDTAGRDVDGPDPAGRDFVGRDFVGGDFVGGDFVGGDFVGGDFVGRAEERRRLVVAAQVAVSRGRPVLALISGDAGAGKTALAEALAGTLAGSGWTTVWGRCPEYEGAPVAWPWLQITDALSAATRGLPASAFPTAPPDALPATDRDLSTAPSGHSVAGTGHSAVAGHPETAGRTDTDPAATRLRLPPAVGRMAGDSAAAHPETTGDVGADPAATRFRLRRAASALVGSVARAAPTLIVLDDLHWADEGTLDLLAGLLVGPDAVDGPVLIIGTYRATEITPELRAALARFARAEPARVYLGGLPADETGDLAAAVAGLDLAPDVVALLHRRTGGNPFFVRELARVLAAEGPDALTRVPAGVRDVIRHRVTRLPATAQTLLHRAAVLGRDVDPEVLAALAGLDDDTLLDALESAVGAGLLAEDGGRLRFTHILVRDTVYGDLSALRRARWHAAAGTALERLRPDDAATLAHHFARAAADDASKSARYARTAAEQAEQRGNPHEAARMWQLAVDAHDRAGGARATGTRVADAQASRAPADSDRHTGAQAGDARRAGAQADDARHTGARHAEDRPAAGQRERLTAVLGLGRALAVIGRLDEARRHRADAIEAAEAMGDPEAVAVALTSFDVPAVWPRNDDEELSARIVAAAERVLAAWGTSDVDRAGRELLASGGGESGRTLAGSSGLRSRLLSTMALELRGRTDDRGETAAREAERLARASGEPSLLAFALNARFMHCFGRTGLAAERAAIGAELVELAAGHRLVTYEVLGHLVLLQASCARGDTDAADRHAADVNRLAAHYELPMVGIFTDWYAALRHALHGDPEAAEAAYRTAAARLAGRGMPGMEEGLLALSLSSLTSNAPGWDVPLDAGPYEPWLRPSRLIAAGKRAEARDALRAVPESPRDLFLEARWWLVARAAAELGEDDVLAHARDVLRPAKGELAGGGSGVLSFGSIAV
ncbi:ATP-binding protein [Catenuloplanes japonicus]|uniref:ATP-binding protein n=1 Tax=Catenuloplanes japonicus TaxID=33876 RepID=UPI00068DD6A0|nr:BTAD domain-containing putative transcriptional regulator [Catenuloplanes japonicus]